MAKKTVGGLNYLNEDILFLRNKVIQEYDIVEGGWSVAQNEGLLPDDFVRFLKTLDKKKRHIEIGKYSAENKDFTSQLFGGFKKYMALFREKNGVAEEKILSIKKDSITLYDSRVEKTQFKNVQFTLRETATSYLLLEKKEFFLNSKTGKFWYKGISGDFSIEDTLLEEVKKVMEFAEYKPKKFIFEYLREVRQAYVGRNLAHTYYRELGPLAAYRIEKRMSGHHVYMENVDDDMIDDLVIDHNYRHILMPLIRIMI